MFKVINVINAENLENLQDSQFFTCIQLKEIVITGEHLRTLTLDAFEGVENNYELLLGNLRYINFNKILRYTRTQYKTVARPVKVAIPTWRLNLTEEKVQKGKN